MNDLLTTRQSSQNLVMRDDSVERSAPLITVDGRQNIPGSAQQ